MTLATDSVGANRFQVRHLVRARMTAGETNRLVDAASAALHLPGCRPRHGCNRRQVRHPLATSTANEAADSQVSPSPCSLGIFQDESYYLAIGAGWILIAFVDVRLRVHGSMRPRTAN